MCNVLHISQHIQTHSHYKDNDMKKQKKNNNVIARICCENVRMIQKKMYVSEQLLHHYYYYLSIKSTQNGVPCNLTILIYMNDSSAQYAICIRSSYLLFFSFFHPSALVPTHKQIRVSGAHKHTTYIHTHTEKRAMFQGVCVFVCEQFL